MDVTLSDLQRTYSSKSDEELLVLHARGGLTEIAYQALEAELTNRAILVPPRPQVDTDVQAANEKSRMTLSAHWHGRASLASAYWIVGTLGSWAIYGASILITLFLPVLRPLVVVVLVAFVLFSWVSIWRCWKNTNWIFWGYVARGLVILYVLFAVIVIVRVSFETGLFTSSPPRSILE